MRRLRRLIAVFVTAGLALGVTAAGSHTPGIGAGVAQASASSGLRHLKTVFTWHGNAARLAWSGDGKTLFLANEEGRMSAVKIDASNPAAPQIAATSGSANFLWGVAQRSGVLVFQQSYGNRVARFDPQSFTPLWQRPVGHSHTVVTDGRRIYLPVEGAPGALAVIGAGGGEESRIAAPDPWPHVYGAAYTPNPQRVYVAVEADPARGVQGGIYIYGVSGARPVLAGRIPRAASAVAVSGTRLWTDAGPTLERWDVGDPAHPVRAVAWDAPHEQGSEGILELRLGDLAVNASGTRLYATYGHRVVKQGETPTGAGEGLGLVGAMIFNVAGGAPAEIARHAWRFDGRNQMEPMSLALSPDGKVLAVSYWRYGVRFYGVSEDRFAGLGRVATTGEAHDVYVDRRGLLYVFANDDIQIIDPESGRHLRDVPVADIGDGGWAPFRDGALVVRGDAPTVVAFQDGAIAFKEPLRDIGSYDWSNVFEDPYLYSGGESGFVVQRVTAGGPGHYTTHIVGSVRVPRADGAPRGRFGAAIMALAKAGNLVWGTGPTIGVVAIDVSDPASPRLVFQDRFMYKQNGGHVGIAFLRGRVYAGCGDEGVIIYDPGAHRRVGTITGLNVDFIDTMDGAYLVVANYWYPRLPEGAYLYDVRANPDAPAFLDRFPKPKGDANFRLRVFGTRVYRVPLYGVDILERPGR